MIFWFSVLVFIAGIMTYMLFPRSDAYQIRMYEEEPNIVSFVNQHQAAKNLMYQLTVWKDDGEDKIHVFPYGQLKSSLPKIMVNKHDIYTVRTTGSGSNADSYATALNPDPEKGVDPEGNYTSAVVNLCWSSKKASGFPEGENAACSFEESKPYVITYGYIPDWWSEKTMRRQAWFKAILKRTYGSDSCGILTKRGGYYAIENTQKFTGYEQQGSQRVVPKVVTDALIETVGLNTCETVGCSDPLSDVMFCMSQVPNPYAGNPVFQWDKLNNTGTGHGNGYQKPLIGSFQNETSGQIDLTESGVYTITGVVSGNTRNRTLLDPSFASETGGQLAIGDVSVEVPSDRPYVFIYMGNPSTVGSGEKQKLTLYYTDLSDNEWKATTTATSVNPAPVLSNLQLKDELWALRIYRGELQDRYVLKNNKADRKRFGLDSPRLK